jgi:hypothetical protein
VLTASNPPLMPTAFIGFATGMVEGRNRGGLSSQLRPAASTRKPIRPASCRPSVAAARLLQT